MDIIIMTTAEYLTQLSDSKEDMKSAIESKGVTVTGGLSTYADAIYNIGRLPTKNITFIGSTFKSAPLLITYEYTYMDLMFSKCENLEIVPLYDCSNVVSMKNTFMSCDKLTTLGGFKNIGKAGVVIEIDLHYSPNITHESIMNVIYYLYHGKIGQTLRLHSKVLALLSDEEKAIATNKGWNIIA